MKLNKYSWLAALPLLFTACQDDMLVEKHSQQGIYTLTATVEDGSANSRAQIVLNGTSTTKESFHWNEGDAFTLFELDEGNNMSAKKFTITSTYSDDAPMASADFTTMDESLVVGRKFSAFYPQPVMNEESPYNVDLKLNNVLSDNSKESWVNYFKNNMFMMAQGTVSDPTSIKFSQLCGIVRITYKNTSSEDRTIKGIYVNGSWGNGVGYSLDNLDITGGSGTSYHGLDFENTATIAANSSEDFYILFMQNVEPMENQMPLSQVSINLGNENYMSTPEYNRTLPLFEIGKCYWLNITDDGDNLFWTKDEDYVPPMEEFMECADFITLKAALANEMVKEITLTKDIALLSPMEVNHEVSLNLNGKKLTLGDEYVPGNTDAVIDITADNIWVNFKRGTIQVGSGTTSKQDNLITMSGERVQLEVNDVNIISEGLVPNIFHVDNDMLNIYFDNENVEGQLITTGNVFYSETPADDRGWNDYVSAMSVNGTIKGNFYFKGSTEGYLNQLLRIEHGEIDGNLVFEGVNDRVAKSDYISYHNENVKFSSASDGWDQAKMFASEQMFEVTNLTELNNALTAKQEIDEMTSIYLKNDLELTSPITVDKAVCFYLQGNKLSLSSNFAWGSSDAAITNTAYLHINNGTVEGSASDEGKYMFKSASLDKRLNFGGVTLNTTGSLNAVYVDNSEFTIYDYDAGTSITVPSGKNAIYAVASTRESKVELDHTGTITGHICFDLNYNNNDENNQSRLYLGRGKVIGDLIKTGSYQDYLQVVYGEGEAEGTGWPSVMDSRCVYIHTDESSQNGYKPVDVIVRNGASLTGNTTTGAIALDGVQYAVGTNASVELYDPNAVTPEWK